MNGPKIFMAAAVCVLATLTNLLADARLSQRTTNRGDAVDPMDVTARLREPVVAGLVDEILKASGVEDLRKRARYEHDFAIALSEVAKSIGRTQSHYRRARKMHDALHARVLRKYTPTADGIDAILDRGEYNCVSATLFYGLAARTLGLDVHVVETPRHIFLRLHADGRDVDIESTSAAGFDFRGDLERFRRFTLAYRFATMEEMERRGPYARFERFEEPTQAVSLEEATSFLWHNTAERALGRGDTVRAAASFVEVFRSNPELAARSEGFATSLARAFRIEYEAGRFEPAFRIAAMELQVFPRKTTSRDRLLGAAFKRIEAACEEGDPASAEVVLGQARKVITVPSDFTRLERETCPYIAAAAVRVGDWQGAHRMAARYVAAEPDPVEAGRFLAWIETRESQGPSLDHDEICWEPRYAQPQASRFGIEDGGLINR